MIVLSQSFSDLGAGDISHGFVILDSSETQVLRHGVSELSSFSLDSHDSYSIRTFVVAYTTFAGVVATADVHYSNWLTEVGVGFQLLLELSENHWEILPVGMVQVCLP